MSESTPVPDAYKRCSNGEKCVNPLGSLLPATTEFFAKHRMTLSGRCRACHRAYDQSPERKARRQLPEYKDRNKAYSQSPERKAWQKAYSQTPEVKARKRARKKSPEYKAYQREYDQSSEVKASQKAYRQSPEGKARLKVHDHCRRARKASLPATFTATDWQRSLDYFNGCCAVCGRPPGLWHTLAADHWIPLTDPRSDNPGTVPWNIVPLCHGVEGCNNSKNDRDAADWLAERYADNPRKGRCVLKKIEDYLSKQRE